MSHTTSVSPLWRLRMCRANRLSSGLISQVAEDLWEVKNKTVTNLTRQDITIIHYKKALAKRSQSGPSSWAFLTSRRSGADREGETHIKERDQGSGIVFPAGSA